MIQQDHLLKVADTRTLQQIHTQTLRLLAETGVVFDSEEIVARFKKKGEKVSGKRVYLSEGMITKALETCPKSFTMTGRNGIAPVFIGDGQPSTVVSPGNGTLFIQDLFGQRRRATLEDFDNITRLCENSANVNLVGSIPVDPCDVTERSKPARLVHHLMQHSNKPLIGQAATCQEAREVFDIIEIAIGQKGFLDDHVAISYSVNPASPLCFEPLTCETILAYAQKKQSLFILPGILPGLTGPLDVMGLVVLSNAEILAALACIQMINPGTPVVYTAGTFMVNMKNFYAVTGSPQAALVNIAGIQMAREVYKIPSRTMAGLTDAKRVDYQAGAETMQNLTLYTAAGVHIINECLGVMDSITTTSYEKWILDDELLDRLQCFSIGFGQMRIDNSLDVIQEIGPGGNYLQHETTMQNYRSIYMPAVSDWNPYDIWEKKGKPDLLEKAGDKCRMILEQRSETVLLPEVDREIALYLDQAR